MKTALLIHSCLKGNDVVCRHWPYYKKSGWTIFGVGRTNTVCLWPESMVTKNIGTDAYISGSNLPMRLVDTYDWFLSDTIFKDYTHCCVIEYDTIFLKPSPETNVEASAHLAGGPIGALKARCFYHCPWWLNRQRAKQFVDQGLKLLKQGDNEQGNPDFFFAYVFQTLHIPVANLPGTFSRNSFDLQWQIDQCRDEVRKDKLWFIHGIKTQSQLDQILS